MRWPLVATFVACAGMAQAQCRQALALGIDVSGSVDPIEYQIQSDGLAAALMAPDVVESFLLMPDASVALAVYEWSGASHQAIIQPWTNITSLADLQSVAARIKANVRIGTDPGTALGIAMQTGLDLLAQRPDCWSHTLDISGDGKNNTGPEPSAIHANAGNVTINGLVIGEELPAQSGKSNITIAELTAYYHFTVKYGPLAFVQTALGFEDFERAMTEKLLRELEFMSLSQLDQ